MRFIVNTDGAARGNPGPSSAGVIIYNEAGEVKAAFGRVLGSGTNNEAEYRAIIAGLQRAIELAATDVELRSDSQLLVYQLTGRYRVKAPNLQALYRRALELSKKFSKFTANHVPREQNKEADRLANRALDAACDVDEVGAPA